MKKDGELKLPLDALYPLIEEQLLRGGEVCISVRGNSMAPFLRDGRDRVVFAPVGDRKIRRGDIVFYQQDNGQFVMHRVYAADENGVMTLLGDAQMQLEPGIRAEQLRAYVPRVVRNGKMVSCEKGLWHFVMCVYLWRIRFPLAARAARFVLRYPYRLLKMLKI